MTDLYIDARSPGRRIRLGSEVGEGAYGTVYRLVGSEGSVAKLYNDKIVANTARIEAYRDKMVLFAGIEHVRFKRQVKPGDTLRIETTLTQIRRGIGMGSGVATVDGELACRGEIMFALVDKPAALGG
mgnify:CR=1 FL=1